MTGRILVVDDVATNRMLLAARLGASYYDVLTASDGPDALEICAEEEPDLILLDVMMPGMDGYEVCRQLKSNPAVAHIPVIMITALNTAEERVRGLLAGADDFLSKPFNELELNARVRNLLRMKMMIDELRLREETTAALGIDAPRPDLLNDAARGSDVMMLCADPVAAAERAQHLRDALGVRVRLPENDREMIAQALLDPPDAMLVERRLPGAADGLRLVSALRARPATRQSAILLMVPEGDAEAAATGLDLGANDYLFAPYDMTELVARLRSQLRRKRYSDHLRDSVRDGLMMAVTDPLTGLFNRRYASTHLDGMLRQCSGAGMPLGAMMLDLDRFKMVNDTYGHAAGDEVLREFSRRLKANVRGADLAARLGGEEFFVAMPDASEEEVAAAAERVRQAVVESPFEIDNGAETINVTVSIGVAMATIGENDGNRLIDRADTALYSSKSAGRNRVSFSHAA